MEIINKIKALFKTSLTATMAMVVIMVIIGIIFFGFAEVFAFVGVIIAGLSFVGGFCLNAIFLFI